MKPVTAGERAFLLIRNEVLDAIGNQHIRWANLGVLFDHVGGCPEFGNYLRGAVSIHGMRRLLRFWDAERPTTPDESQYVRKVSRFISDEVFPGLDESLTARLSRAVIAAEGASCRPISPGVRNAVLRSSIQPQCYLCAKGLDPKVPSGHVQSLTLEHLWPTSIGGDSIEDNLLPACSRCQNVTKDAMSWEWLNVHNLVLPIIPSDSALKSVELKTRYARHYFEAIQTSDHHNITLKAAFLRLGASKTVLTHRNTGLPITFFDLETSS